MVEIRTSVTVLIIFLTRKNGLNTINFMLLYRDLNYNSS